jgi:hypothetical protein
MLMMPSEGEMQAAITASAKQTYENLVTRTFAKDDIVLPPWEDLDPMHRNAILDEAQSWVWPALKALPDRLEPVRGLIQNRQGIDDWDLLVMIERLVDGSPR